MNKKIPIRVRLILLTIPLVLGLGLLTAALAGLSGSASAAPASQTPMSNDTCLTCHSQPNTSKQLGGETLLLTVEKEMFDLSVHGNQGVACVQCHTDIASFPHPDYSVGSKREMQLALYGATRQACIDCHQEQSANALNGVHQQALEAGNTNAAICADCHDPHYQAPLEEQPRSASLETCARCHSTIYETYTQSIHGAALIDENNPDVPTCVDCHGAHGIQNPRAAEFRNTTPQLCATCHTDAAIMDKYGLSTAVLSTYVADFHGTTVTLFEAIHPDQPTDKPVCTDCHGVHGIRSVDDPQYGIGMKENLQAVCERCHPGASADFPNAWMGHYIPSPDRYPVVYFVDLFYKILIPLVLGGMAGFVISDFTRRLIERRKGGMH